MGNAGITDYFGIEALSRPSLSRTFQGLEKWKKISGPFKKEWTPCARGCKQQDN